MKKLLDSMSALQMWGTIPELANARRDILDAVRELMTGGQKALADFDKKRAELK
jgi:hypothetical protein